jgi:hypothetical protein
MPWYWRDGAKVAAISGFTYEDYASRFGDHEWENLRHAWRSVGHDWQPGIVTAEAAGALILDWDDLASLERFEEEVCPLRGTTWSWRTGRDGGGMHFLYRRGELLTSWPVQGPIGAGWRGEVKSNGFCAVPPALHPSGRRYEAEEAEEAGPAAVPYLLALFLGQRRVRSSEAGGGFSRGGGESAGPLVSIDDLLASGAGEPGDGRQRRALLSLTAQLAAQGASEGLALSIWRAVLANTPVGDPARPWTEGDFEVFFRSARQKHESTAGLPSAALQLWSQNLPVPAPLAVSGNGAHPAGALPGGNAGWAGAGGGSGVARPAGWASFVPDDYVVPPGYDIRQDGVFREVRDRNGEVRDFTPISHRPVIISGMASDAGGDDVWYELRWLDIAAEQKSVMTPAASIADPRQLPKLFGDLVVTGHTAGALARFLGELTAVNGGWLLPRSTRVATQLGWQGEGTGGRFVFGPERPFGIRDVKNTREWVAGHRVSGTVAGWRAAMECCAGRPLPIAAVAAALSAPLLRILGQAPFVFDISAGTSTGKTVTLGLAASVWGDPARLVQAWNNTLVANEHFLSCLRGLPFFLNESQLAAPESVAALVYSLTEGHSKGRSKQDGSGLLSQVQYESVIISCGENTLVSFTKQGGVVPRVVTAEGDPMSSAAMADAVRDAVSVCYGHAGELFMRALAEITTAELRSRHRMAALRLRELVPGPVAGRRSDSVAVMVLAAEVAASAGIVPAAPSGLWPDLAAGGGALEEGADDRPEQALLVLATEVALNQGAFWVENTSELYSITPSGGWLGRWQPGEYLAVKPAWLREFLERHGHDFDRTVKSWRDRRWLDAAPGAMTTVVRVKGRGARSVKIIAAELLEAVGCASVGSAQLG